MAFNWLDPFGYTKVEPTEPEYVPSPIKPEYIPGFNEPEPIVVAPDSGTSKSTHTDYTSANILTSDEAAEKYPDLFGYDIGFDFSDPFGFNKVAPTEPEYVPTPIKPEYRDEYLRVRFISPFGSGTACTNMIAVVQNGYKYWLTLPEYQALGSPAIEEVTETEYMQIPDGKADIIINGTKITAKDTTAYCTVSTGKDTGKELVMEFSGPIDNSLIIQKITEYGTKIMKLVGGTEVYIEDRTKLVVAL